MEIVGYAHCIEGQQYTENNFITTYYTIYNIRSRSKALDELIQNFNVFIIIKISHGQSE